MVEIGGFMLQRSGDQPVTLKAMGLFICRRHKDVTVSHGLSGEADSRSGSCQCVLCNAEIMAR